MSQRQSRRSFASAWRRLEHFFKRRISATHKPDGGFPLRLRAAKACCCVAAKQGRKCQRGLQAAKQSLLAMTEQDRDEPSRDDIPPLRSRGGPSPSRFDAPPLQRRGGPSREPSPEPATRKKKKGRGSSTPRSSSPRSTPRHATQQQHAARDADAATDSRGPRGARAHRQPHRRNTRPGEYTPPVVRSTIGGSRCSAPETRAS